MDRGDRRVQVLADLSDLLQAAVTTDGEHHKQWYLEQIAETLGIELQSHEPGIAP